ncbi:cation:proton antiporter subunit C [Desulfobotulus sp. H1]|uniref:Cation:proton antiporter subunit C n=1 Tax=Desulfobotulus pelophilus TaxID=2823377 RepID=A0ABT3NBB2_9BACT|nr:cation:proton antiporter subunit C [Desulfobotulus pelophilus]MCW7754760.1 cation:proton antiporter subunit C [Desulfobotulus pelophilus]
MDAIPYFIGKYNYWGCIFLFFLGMYAMISKTNLVKKIIGLNIFQTSIILFFISASFKKDATLPILMEESKGAIDPAMYLNPLPHVLMLTAIVVAVATLGVALALTIKVYRSYGTLEEDEINRAIQSR